MKKAPTSTATNWLANPAVPYVAAAGGAALIIYLLPNLIGRIFKGADTGYNAGKDLVGKVANDVVDSGIATIGEVSSIVGKPNTELPGQQTLADKAKGLLAGGDSRTWSDLADWVGL